MAYRGEVSDKEFETLIAEMKKKGKGRKYDCVIGISGGIDSSYVAYLAKEKGLRAILVHLNNGWNSTIAKKNMDNIVDILGYDYEEFVIDKDEFRQIQLAFLKASVPDIEAPTDMAIPAALHSIAKKYDVKYIVSGGNFATEGILPNTWFYNAKDVRYFKSILKQHCTIKPKQFPFFGWLQEGYLKTFKDIKTVYFLNYVPFSKALAIKTLEEKLNWKFYGGKHYESSYTGFVQSYILPEKFNADYRRATLSTQICAGTATREQAIEELKHKAYNEETIQSEIEYICKELGLTKEEFDKIMHETPKTYRDYPNSEQFLDKLYGIYRMLHGKKDYRK